MELDAEFRFVRNPRRGQLNAIPCFTRPVLKASAPTALFIFFDPPFRFGCIQGFLFLEVANHVPAGQTVSSDTKLQTTVPSISIIGVNIKITDTTVSPLNLSDVTGFFYGHWIICISDRQKINLTIGMIGKDIYLVTVIVIIFFYE